MGKERAVYVPRGVIATEGAIGGGSHGLALSATDGITIASSIMNIESCSGEHAAQQLAGKSTRVFSPRETFEFDRFAYDGLFRHADSTPHLSDYLAQQLAAMLCMTE